MLNKLIQLIMLGIVVITVPFAVFADNGTVTPTSTQEPMLISASEPSTLVSTPSTVDDTDAQVLTTQHGAELRIQQLSNLLAFHIEKANEVISTLQANNNTKVDYASLAAIVGSFTDLKAKVDATDLTKTNQVLVSEFVTYKKQAIDLTAQFKKTVHVGIIENQAAMFKQQVEKRFEVRKLAIQERQKLKEQKIELLKKNVERSKLQEKIVALGIATPAEVQAALAGNFTNEQIKARIQTWAKNLTPEQRKEFAQKAKEGFQKQNIERKEQLVKIQDQMKAVHEQALNDIKKVQDERRVHYNLTKQNWQAAHETIKADRAQVIAQNRELVEKFRKDHQGLIDQVRTGKLTKEQALAKVSPADIDKLKEVIAAPETNQAPIVEGSTTPVTP